MVTDTQALDPELPHELAHRNSSWIEVTLLWRPAGNMLTVRLVEVSTGVEVEFAVGPEHALDAFNHPYAYLRVPTERVPPPASRPGAAPPAPARAPRSPSP